MAEKLRELYPEYYYKIVSIFKKNNLPFYIPIHSCFDIESKKITHKALKAYNTSDFKQKENFTDDRQNNKSVLLKIAETELDYMLKEIGDDEQKKKLKKDFNEFKKNVITFLKTISQECFLYMYGRDIESIKWYCQIFGNKENKNYLKQSIVCCNEIKIDFIKAFSNLKIDDCRMMVFSDQLWHDTILKKPYELLAKQAIERKTNPKI
ncbi:MAG: hypothetical protein J0I09_07400 [Sphingobacteriia bacterium]|nr:hypothetical protein [Sphingobacteriia bacterium]